MQQDQLAQFFAQRMSLNTRSLLGEVFGETIELRSQLELAQAQRQDLEAALADLTRQLAAANERLGALAKASEGQPQEAAAQ